nr:hypothetical protein [Tanacetum cinerariifolium]
MLVEMADMMKRAPIGRVENVHVKIDKFLFPSDFVVIDVKLNETMTLGRPFLATIHAEIDVFNKEFSLGIGNDREKLKRGGLSFHEFLLVRYGEAQCNDLIWDSRFSQQGNRIHGLLDSFSCGKKRLLYRRNHFAYAVTDVYMA